MVIYKTPTLPHIHVHLLSQLIPTTSQLGSHHYSCFIFCESKSQRGYLTSQEFHNQKEEET